MFGTVNNNIPYTNLHNGKVENGQLQSVNANKNVGVTEDDLKQLTANRDEYIKGAVNTEKSTGIYRLEKDENGNQRIVFDRPDSEQTDELADIVPEESEKEDKPEKSSNDEGGLYCRVDTDKVDAEIKKLQTQKQQVQQELNRVSGDEQKSREVEQRLAQIKSELSAKGNNAYKKANASYTYSSTPI